jgi:hypothetical protein
MKYQAIRENVVCGHYHPTMDSSRKCATKLGPKWTAECRASFADIPLTLRDDLTDDERGNLENLKDLT